MDIVNYLGFLLEYPNIGAEIASLIGYLSGMTLGNKPGSLTSS